MSNMLKALARIVAAVAVVFVLGIGTQQALASARTSAEGCVCDFDDPDADKVCVECCMAAGSVCTTADICICG